MGSRRSRWAAPSTSSVARVFVARRASTRRASYVNTAAACRTASHPDSAWVTASGSRTSPRAVSTAAASTPTGASAGRTRAGSRARSRTACPRARRAATACAPTNPVPPVTRTRTATGLRPACCSAAPLLQAAGGAAAPPRPPVGRAGPPGCPRARSARAERCTSLGGPREGVALPPSGREAHEPRRPAEPLEQVPLGAVHVGHAAEALRVAGVHLAGRERLHERAVHQEAVRRVPELGEHEPPELAAVEPGPDGGGHVRQRRLALAQGARPGGGPGAAARLVGQGAGEAQL